MCPEQPPQLCADRALKPRRVSRSLLLSSVRFNAGERWSVGRPVSAPRRCEPSKTEEETGAARHDGRPEVEPVSRSYVLLNLVTHHSIYRSVQLARSVESFLVQYLSEGAGKAVDECVLKVDEPLFCN